MNKKVGLAIVTYGTNYGTYLQAFATQHIVQKMGYETEAINIDSVKSEVGKARKKYFAKQVFNLPELRSYLHVLIGIASEKVNPKYKSYIENRKLQLQKFKQERFHFSKVADSWQGLTKLCEENYDHVLVGSDQLWRPANIAGNFYTLNFVPDNINKIAYATSFGLKEIRENQKQTAKHFLSRIDHLSVREKSGAEIVRGLTDRKIPVVCDPTMLLTKEEWGSFVADEPIVRGNYVLCYFLGDNKDHRRFAEKLAKKTGCKVVGVLHIAGYMALDRNFGDIVPENIGPFEFLNLIKNAEYVCTDSFHGCVFTSIFNRRLFAFRRFSKDSKMSTNDRITTLLSMLGMEKTLVYGTEDIESCLKYTIAYPSVEERLQQKRSESLAYLEKAFANHCTDI